MENFTEVSFQRKAKNANKLYGLELGKLKLFRDGNYRSGEQNNGWNRDYCLH